MTEPPDDSIEERLRAILRAEAGSVDSSPEALNAIRARTQQRSGWFAALFNAPWLRPSLAVGAAALIVGSVLMGAPQVRDQILPQSLTSPAQSGQGGSGGGDNGASDKDALTGETPPEQEDPADRPSGGAEPTADPGTPADPDDETQSYGTTEHCISGTEPTHNPKPTSSAGGTATGGPGGGSGTSGSRSGCGPSGRPTAPGEHPPPEQPGDGSTGDSTTPPGDTSGEDDSAGDGGTPTTGPDDTATGDDPILDTE
ncbi:hypothetical protein GCM10027570_43850 [Streptomonospora sediminis]